MTTDKTPATLATVKHGGCVQLGASERARFDAFLRDNPFMALMAGTAWQVWQAALSAQPSPGGQGDALLDHARKLFDEMGTIADDDKCVAILADALAARQPVRIYGCCEQPEGELHTAECPNMRHIAARQPVVQEPFGHAMIDGMGRVTGVKLFRRGESYHYTVADFADQDRIYPACAPHVGMLLYAAPAAQAVDLGQLPHGIRLIEIPGRNNLDPINVFVQDYELGRGRIVVTCYGQAWCGFWGAMGDRTVMQFVAACDADYVAGNMLSGRHEHVKKHERVYVERIAAEVIAEFRALIDSQAVGNGH